MLRCGQSFREAFDPIRPILLQDNAKWKGGDPDIGIKCALHSRILEMDRQ